MKTYLLIIAGLASVLSACDAPKGKPVVREVVADTVFTNQFLPKGAGFTGSDATYSVVLPDGRTIWIFGDTFLGNVTPDNHRVKTTPAYIRNSFVVIEKEGLKTYHQGEPHEFKSMMIPPEVADGTSGKTELQLWYWPGDAFIEKGLLNVFVSKFSQEDHNDMWAFEFEGTEMQQFTLPDFKLVATMRFANLDTVHYGHAVLEARDSLYIYGLKKGQPYLAKVSAGDVRSNWQFYNGSSWTEDAGAARPVLDFSGSEQFSVFAWKGVYVMIMQEGHLGPGIYSFTSKTPWGPWENKRLIYETPPLDNCADCWTYNALAHPQFTADDMLLVSYNTNSTQMQDHYDNALIYRPRFIRVPMERILE